MRKYTELELFTSLQIIEKMRMEVIHNIQDLKEEEMKNNEDSYTLEGLKQTRLEALKRLGSYRLLHFKTNEDSFVAHQFSYYGTLPPYKEGYHTLVKQYYNSIHSFLYDKYDKELAIKGKAYLVLAHYFEDKKIRDLDNRNRKYIIDMLRGTPLLTNDTWQDLCIYEEGFLDSVPHLQVYLLDKKHKNAFNQYFDERHESLKIIPTITEIQSQIYLNEKESKDQTIANNQPIEIEEKVFYPSLED